DLEFRERRKGFVISSKSEKLFCKASSIHRELSKSSLINRFKELNLETTNITPKEKFNKFYNMPPNPLYKKYLDIEATKEKLRNDELNLIKLRRNEFKNSIHTMKYDSLTINHIKNQRMIFKNQTKEIYSKYKKISYRNFLINEAYNGNENAIKALESKINKDIQTSKNTFSGKFKKDIFANPNYITKEGYKVYQTGTQKII
ncbi:DNA polymerase, partial [Campylobacter fetus subsp. testudinum]